MAPTYLSKEECNASVGAFLDEHLGMVHCDDIGPLLGQLAFICDDTPPDPAARRYWPQALTAALADDPRTTATQDSAAAASPNDASSRIASAISCT